ncbi:MAG: YraN family protein [Armatimonadota bacterium]
MWEPIQRFGNWLRRFLRERTPGWEGANAAEAPSTREKGRRSEKVARWYLEKHGYRIIETNWWAPGRRGELDVIACKHDTLIAIEVKSYPVGELTPREALSRDKARRLVSLLKQYAKSHRHLDCSLRIDLLLVEWEELGKIGEIRHIKNAVAGG